jgi:hypothetical protein
MTSRTLPVTAAIGHAFNSTWNNLGFAFHATWPWLVALVPISVYTDTLAAQFVPKDGQTPTNISAEQVQAVLLFYGMLFVSILIYSSIAVTWHRYILKDEVPQGMARLRLDWTVWRYVGNTILVALMIVLVMLPIVGLGVLLAPMFVSPVVPYAIMLSSIALILPIFYRLSIKLPAIAIGEDRFRFGDAWNATRGNMGQLLLLGVLTGGVVLLVSFLSGALEAVLLKTGIDGMNWITAVIRQLVSWVFSIFTITVLTSLYGFFVEKRDF